MAYEANISLKLKGYEKAQRQINTLVESVNKIQKAFTGARNEGQRVATGLRQANTQLTNAVKTSKRLTTALRGASKAAREIKSGTINSTVNQTINEASGGGGGNAGGAALVSAAILQDTKKIKAETKELTQLNQKNLGLQEKLSKANTKRAEKAAEIKKLTRDQNFADGNVKRIQSQINRSKEAGKKITKETKDELLKAQINAKEIKNQINRANSSARGLKTSANGIAAELKASVTEARKLGGSLDAAAAKARKVQIAAKSALAGAAFANIPGQDLFQAGSAGALVGGPKGALIAAGTALTLKLATATAQYAKEAAIAAAAVQKLEIALAGVAGVDTERGLKAIRGVVEDFNIPLEDATRGFTRLFASATASGASAQTVENSFRGLAAANKALGGDTQKLNGILLAATQVFAKGKVSAEELRGQIGERLPGAVSIFAQATGRTVQELDKALDKGEVRLEDFVKFTELLLKKYESDAKIIADSPSEAGARLERNLKDLQNAIGKALLPIGAAFQNFASDVIEAFFNIGKAIDEFRKKITDLPLVNNAQIKQQEEFVRRLKQTQKSLFQQGKIQEAREFAKTILKAQQALDKLKGITGTSSNQTDDFGSGTTSGEGKEDTAGKRLAEQIALYKEIEPLLIQQTKLKKQLALAVGDENEETRRQLDYKIKSLDLAIAQVKALQGITDEERKQQIIRDFARQQDVLRAQLSGDRLEAEQEITAELGRQTQKVLDQIDAQEKAEQKAEARRQEFEDNVGKDIKDKIELQKAVLAGKEDEYKRQKMIDDLIKNSTLDGVSYMSPETAARLVDTFLQGEKAVAQYNKQLEMTKQLGLDLKNALDTAIVDTITAAIDGTKDLNAVLSDTLKQVGRLLLNFGVKTLTSGILGFKDGGVAPAGQTSVVGENGPELITPLVPTMVSPFDENRDTLATQATKAFAADAFGEASEAMGQSTYASAGSMTIQTQVINSVEYATVDQVQAAANAASKKATAKVFSDLKNKPSARAGIGL